MKSKPKYTEGPMGELKVIKDFLPPPDQLVVRTKIKGKQKGVRSTL